ncbi:WD repeat-containing protein [Rhodotorula toruloides ATCC 204091]|uniref:BY PROTMAP: gi/342320211/gb/EGU12153.1/ WD repeat-containing protein [Rhodotorula glutinis ATCC 204091] n=1 Tax=Rhodotorula toruloides TaxID=5286 RepID=A0A0K3CMX6_RHOTO|nr:WD repeat-containing protein [Rhodotorula toruloides ATCC 204091]
MATSRPPLVLPGYIWDEQTRRYYKQPKNAAAPIPRTASPRQTSSATRHGREAGQGDEGVGGKRKRARVDRKDQKGKGRAGDEEGSLANGLRDLYLGDWQLVGQRQRLQHDILLSSLSRLSPARTMYPDCLPMDDTILHLAFDDADPARLRVGTSNGTIATGNLAPSADELAYFPNDEERWRTGWFLPSKITSLKSSGKWMVATCLGPPAQAVIATTQDSISLASVTLSPRKTSLWTSAISSDLVALGGDRSVLLTPLSALHSSSSTRPSSPIDTYTTGGRGGGGTVFSLDVPDEGGGMVWAGVRRGECIGFDWRSARGGGGEARTKEQTAIKISSPVTHVKVIREQPHQLLVAGMDGFLALYDLRFVRPPTLARDRRSTAPMLHMKGHVNSFSTELGMDVWKDEVVAIVCGCHALETLVPDLRPTRR